MPLKLTLEALVVTFYIVAWLPTRFPVATALRLGPSVESWHSGGGGSTAAAAAANPDSHEQCFPWTRTWSIARESFDFPTKNGSRRQATGGQLIPLQCDSIICPVPRVPNCYMDDSVCGVDEWCMLEDQVRFGPWALGVDGETPNLKDSSCEQLREGGYNELFDRVCAGHRHWGPWLAMRGRCVKYRQLEESCNAYYVGGGSLLGPQYAVDTVTGSPPKRPLLCAPGLVCTGDMQPVPHTCVKARPRDVCYQGSWWDSTSWCKQHGSGGLSRQELQEAATALILQLPVEVFDAQSPAFWSDPAANRARSLVQRILEVLWPEAYRAETSFPLPLPVPKGKPGGKEWNATATRVEGIIHQANKVWSTIHTLIHNTGSPMSRQQVEASRALAVWLRQHFFCCNCRGFWSSEVLDTIGLPPDSESREAHKRWWWMAHNMASEHSAATRGGHPWIYPAYPRDQQFQAEFAQYGSEHIRCQNPWFLPLEHAEEMWAIRHDASVQQGRAGSAKSLR